MRLADVLCLSLAALWQHKVRTLLTLVGVTTGSFALIVSLSVGRGVEGAILKQFERGQQLRQVDVWPGYEARDGDVPAEDLKIEGAMSEAKRARLRQALLRRWRQRHPGRTYRPLTRDRVAELEALPHVERVVPRLQQDFRAVWGGRKAVDVVGLASAADNAHLRGRLVAGDFLPSDGGRDVVVHEFLLYLWGITGDDEVNSVLGKKLRLEGRGGRRGPMSLPDLIGASRLHLTQQEGVTLTKALWRMADAADKLGLSPEEQAAFRKAVHGLPDGPSAPGDLLFAEEFTVVGVVREVLEGEPDTAVWVGGWGAQADVILPVRTAEEFFYRSPAAASHGFDAVTLTADSPDHVREVAARVKAMGLRPFSLADFLDDVRRNLVLVTFVTAFLAAVALLVAALGITNTMTMSVLERTHEIGVMKAVGGRDLHVQLLFLVEGAAIGAAGGALGLLFAWLASFPGDAVAKSLIATQTNTKLEETVFVFPPWVALGVPVFAALVTTLAAAYPARRAARVDPVAALRHE